MTSRFDLVYSVDVIHHVGDRSAAAREAFRVLRLGGVLAIATDSEDDIERRIPLATHFPETVAAERCRYPQIATIESELREAGFTGIERRHVHFAYSMRNLQPYRDKAFSSLHLIDDEAFQAGLRRLEEDVAAGPIRAESHYTIVIARRLSDSI
jgi:SAM-dependent methyltransferase